MTTMADAFGYDEWGNAPHLLAPVDAKALEENNWTRAAGDTICEHCGLTYRQHPEVQGCLWLRRTCKGGLVKL